MKTATGHRPALGNDRSSICVVLALIFLFLDGNNHTTEKEYHCLFVVDYVKKLMTPEKQPRAYYNGSKFIKELKQSDKLLYR